jgi:hypothetical protein
MDRPLGIKQFLEKKYPVMEFTGVWKDVFGRPDPFGSWIIWGSSGNGKTRFAIQLCKYLTRFGKVAYDSLEEGYRGSLQRAFIEAGMKEVSSRLVLWSKASIPEVKKRLKKKNSPHIIFIDSFQYTRMTYEDYLDLTREFPRKLFIFVSHAEGKEPRGAAAQSVRYDCELKIRVEGFRAMAASRAGGGACYTIWEEGANVYWGENKQPENDYI